MDWPKRTTACFSLVSLVLRCNSLAAQAPAGDEPAEKIIISLEDKVTGYAPLGRAPPVVNAEGTTAFIQSDNTTAAYSVVLQKPREKAKILVSSGPAPPGLPADYFLDRPQHPALNDANDVAVAAGYGGPFVFGQPQDLGGVVYLSINGGNPTMVLRSGGPETPTYGGFSELLMNNKRDLCFEAGVGSTVDESGFKLYRAFAPGYLPEKVIGIGEALPGAPVGTGYYPSAVLGTTGERHTNYIDEYGDVAVLSSAAKGANGVWKQLGLTLIKVVMAGDGTPGLAGVTFQFIDRLHMNGAGEMVISATLSNSWRSIWYADRQGALRLVARTGQQLATNLGAFDDVQVGEASNISSTGAIPFVAVLTSPHPTLDIVEAVLLWNPDGTYSVIAGNADSAPGLPQGYFTSFRNAVANQQDQVLFAAQVSTLNAGLWVGSPTAPPILIAATGATLRYGTDPAGEPLVTGLLDTILVRAMDSSQPYWDRWGQLGDGGHVVLPVMWRRQAGLFRIGKAGSLVVNSTSGEGDLSPGDGSCDTGSEVVDLDGNTVPECTLRAAIEEANTAPDRTRIAFAIPGEGIRTIALERPLPEVIHPVEIDASTQPGYLDSPMVEIDGQLQEAVDFHGLVISGGDSVVKALGVVRCDANGIVLKGEGGNKVLGCWIGTRGAGEPGWGNKGDGILIEQSADNIVGDEAAGEGNTILNNGLRGTGGCGVRIVGVLSARNRVSSNLIGQKGSGDAFGRGTGICIEDASETLVGGVDADDAFHANFIVNNHRAGIIIQGVTSQAPRNRVEFNLILQTTDDQGAHVNQNGLEISDAVDTEVVDNLISGHRSHGVFIFGVQRTEMRTVLKGNDFLPVADFLGPLGDEWDSWGNGRDGIHIRQSAKNRIGGGQEGDTNFISGNGRHGIAISGELSRENEVIGNSIGPNIDGEALVIAPGSLVVPTGYGVLIEDGASLNRIGAPVAGNLISGNGSSGVAIVSDPEDAVRTRANTMSANTIGLDAEGKAALGNGGNGILILHSPENTIGGFGEIEGNVISGNDRVGIAIEGSGSEDNVVEGNLIGTDPSGLVAIGNERGGVEIYDGGNHTAVGSPGRGNVISGNSRFGIRIESGPSVDGAPAPDSTANVVEANLIGLAADGAGEVPNDGPGIEILRASFNVVGGVAAASRNTISANTGAGVRIEGMEAASNLVRGNWIGTGADGLLTRGNQGEGVVIEGAPQNMIGGDVDTPGQGAGNFIAWNKGSGVLIAGDGMGQPDVLQNSVTGNRIDQNGGAGVLISNASGNTVGPLNLIASNRGSGVQVLEGQDLAAKGNTITQNSITTNQLTGIDLGAEGPTPNDPLDADGGPNDFQNHPTLAYVLDPARVLKGRVESTPLRPLTIEIFDDVLNPMGGNPPEGTLFVASIQVVTDATGAAAFQLAGLPRTCYTATATDDLTGDTSEFSPCAALEDPPVGDPLDFGDAPDPSYPTLPSSLGAAHRILAGFHLGALVDAEIPVTAPDGATADDDLTLDDEDGVAFIDPLLQGANARLQVVASREGRLDAWVDFSGDGDWEDPGEQVFASLLLGAGVNDLAVGVPAAAAIGATYARFRFSLAGGLSPAGPAPEGEVEDYQILIEASAEPRFRRGDADMNGSLEITDAVALLGHLFLGGPEPPCPDAADADDNGSQEITDAVVILGYLFLGGANPASPGPAFCGRDPTSDDLGACSVECEA